MLDKPIARAFLARYLDKNQMRQVREVEASLPPTKYLGVSDCLALLTIKTDLVIRPEQEQQMRKLWDQFCREVLWPRQKWEDSLHPKGCTMTTCNHPPNKQVRTASQEIHDWEDFALRLYRDPDIQAAGLEAAFGAGQ